MNEFCLSCNLHRFFGAERVLRCASDRCRDAIARLAAYRHDLFWTLGQYNIVAILEAPDDISITALGLSTGALGKRPHADSASVHATRHEGDSR